MVETVECYIIKDDSYLMLYRNKMENDMNEGKYIGVGGHIKAYETKEDAIRREVMEETNLKLNSFKYHGKVLFVNDDYEELVHLFTSDDYSGEIKECNEGTLYWIKINKVLDLNLWEGDRIFLPMLKNNEEISIKLIYENGKLKRWCKL